MADASKYLSSNPNTIKQNEWQKNRNTTTQDMAAR